MNGQKQKVLAIDDQPDNLMLLGESLDAFCDLTIATTGEQGLALADTLHPDQILLDVMMPGLDGDAVCRYLRADPVLTQIPVIFLTALNTPEEETRGLDAGAVDFITKPVNIAVLQARVRTHLMLKQQADLLRRLAFKDGLTGVSN